MSPSSIEWTDETWNPTVGCSRVSPGCRNCYAMGQAHRGLDASHRGLTIVTDHGVDWNGLVRQLPDRLAVPLRWRRPRRVFVDSMSDLFHEQVEYGYIARVFGVMAAASQHTFQVLTKRPQRMEKILNDRAERRSFQDCVTEEFETIVGLSHADRWPGWPLPNVWLGTSIELDKYTWRADYVRETPAAIRFLSCEPLLGPLPSLRLAGLDWVIVGGESGPKARPMQPEWVREIRQNCTDCSTPFFFKQWGAWVDIDQAPEGVAVDIDRAVNLAGNPQRLFCVGKKRAGRFLDGRTWDEVPG